jgi:hypothetical protein
VSASALLSAISTDEKSVDWFKLPLILVTALVVIGLVIEYWPEIEKLHWKQPNPDLNKMLFGGLVVTIAIAAEVLITFFAQRAETKLRNDNNSYVSLLEKEASDANLKAETLKSKNLELERIMVPRRIPIDEAPLPILNLIEKRCPQLRSLTPSSILIQTMPEGESKRLTGDIIELLGTYKWQATPIDEKQSGLFPLYIPDGVTIFTPSTQAPFIPNKPSVAPPEDIELTRAATALMDCLNALLGHGSASTRELLPLYLHTAGSMPYFDPQPKSLVIAVGASPVAEKLYLLDSADK